MQTQVGRCKHKQTVIEPTRQVLVANHWTVPLSRIPNSSYTHHKLDHKHDPYPSPSLVNISGASSSGTFTVPGHTYDIGSTEYQVSTWSTWWLATATTQRNSHPAHGSVQNQPIFIAYTAILAHGSIQNQPIFIAYTAIPAHNKTALPHSTSSIRKIGI
ncbi:uncharacterized protein DS421_7g211370 [Arachis hypogaea]|nr:uncharacterized protein DS421_7g211370 [Arachis hypogaea]